MTPRTVLSCLLLAATAATVGACGKDEPLGGGAGTTPKGVSDETTTAQLMRSAVDRGMPSVVAVSVAHGGSIATGTGTVLARGMVVTDAALLGGARPSPAPSPSPTPAPTASPSATPAAAASGTTPSGTTPSGTTPAGARETTPSANAARAGTTPQASPAATPAGTTPATSPTPRPSATPLPAPKVVTPPTVSVREAGGDEHEGTIEGIDRVSGLAVIRVNDLDSVPPAHPSRAPALGEEIATAGYLSARRAAVRPGTIATTGRSVRLNRATEVGLFEATAPLGVQGIGGPVMDGRGQVVGITTRALAPIMPGTVVALPYASALRIARALLSDGQVRRAYLGIDTVGITPDRAEELDLSTAAGVLVGAIVPGSPASFSTLRGPTGRTWIAGRLIPTGSDAITKIDGKPVREPEDIDAELATRKPGEKVALTVIRGSRGLTVHVTLGER